MVVLKKERKNVKQPEDNTFILKHKLVPEHVILSEQEKKEIIKKYAGGDPYKLPYILSMDPVAQAIGAKPGDVIKIIRKSSTAGAYIYYRLVVK